MKCRICGGIHLTTKTFIEKMFGTLREHVYQKCDVCGCYQIAELPTAERIKTFYPDDYYSYDESPFDIFSNRVAKFFRQKRDKFGISNRGLLGRLVYRLKPSESIRCLGRTEIKASSKILDIGCGRGLLLYSLRELGYENLLGADPFIENDISYDNGLLIKKSQIEDISGQWDVVMLHHVLEHVPNPVETIAKASNLLAPDGVCIVRVPVVPNVAFEKYDIDWIDFDAPRHLHNFSVDGIRSIARQSGLVVSDLYYDSTILQFWGSEQYRRGIEFESPISFKHNPKKSIFTRRQIREYRRKTHLLNKSGQGDQAVFYLSSTMDV